MKKYEITVTQKFTKQAIVEVGADNIKKAKERAQTSDLAWQQMRYTGSITKVKIIPQSLTS